MPASFKFKSEGAVVMHIPVAVLSLACICVPLCLAQSNPDLSGTWVDTTNAAAKIAIQEKGDTIKVHETDGDKVVADYTCNLNGQQCDIEEDGHPAKVMAYYNGSKLVEITERGKDVTKRLFSLSKDGNSLTMELVPISSEGKTVTRTFQKQQSQVTNGS
jgi:hypothetical protein